MNRLSTTWCDGCTTFLLAACKGAIDEQDKRSLGEFVNLICGSDVSVVSCAEGQCECLVSAIIVCILCIYIFSFCFMLLYCIYCLKYLGSK